MAKKGELTSIIRDHATALIGHMLQQSEFLKKLYAPDNNAVAGRAPFFVPSCPLPWTPACALGKRRTCSDAMWISSS